MHPPTSFPNHYSTECKHLMLYSQTKSKYIYEQLQGAESNQQLLVNNNYGACSTLPIQANGSTRSSKLDFIRVVTINPLNAELNPICHLLALLGVHHFLHISRIRVKSLTLRLLMSYIYIYIYEAPILDVSRSHTTTHHSR